MHKLIMHNALNQISGIDYGTIRRYRQWSKSKVLSYAGRLSTSSFASALM